MSIECYALVIRNPRAHVPAFTGSYLPAVISITESRTVYLYPHWHTHHADAVGSLGFLGVRADQDMQIRTDPTYRHGMAASAADGVEVVPQAASGSPSSGVR